MSKSSQIFHNPAKQVFENKTKLVLGINQDQYDSDVTLTDGHKVFYSANEERFTRIKNQGYFRRTHHSVRWCLSPCVLLDAFAGWLDCSALC